MFVVVVAFVVVGGGDTRGLTLDLLRIGSVIAEMLLFLLLFLGE